MKKPLKIELAPGVMDAVPEEDREELMAAIKEAFADFDPADPPGVPIVWIESGVTECPRCGALLNEPHAVSMPDKHLVYDCTGCDGVFAHPVQ